jgi:hypothetical protein
VPWFVKTNAIASGTARLLHDAQFRTIARDHFRRRRMRLVTPPNSAIANTGRLSTPKF